MLKFQYENDKIKSVEYKKDLVKKRIVLSLLFELVALLIVAYFMVDFFKNHNIVSLIVTIAVLLSVTIYLIGNVYKYVNCNNFLMTFSDDSIKIGKMQIPYDSIIKCGVIENTKPMLLGFHPKIEDCYCTVYMALKENVDEEKIKRYVIKKGVFHGIIDNELIYIVIKSNFKELRRSVIDRVNTEDNGLS